MTLITTRREKQRETLRDVPCWNQLRQREANSGFMMHEALKIAQGTMDTKGSLLAGEETPPVAMAGTHTHTESTLTIQEYRRTQEEVLE